MVRPVPPNSNNPADTNSDISQNNEVNNSGITDNSALGASGYLPADFNLQRRLGPGFLPRRNEQSSPNRNQAADDGAALYRGFLAEEFRRRNMPQPEQFLDQDSPYHHIQDTSHSADLARAENQLRILSDEFARSPMRQWVEEQAARVPLEELDFNAFSDLLYGLFQEGGVTWERVVVLFYFCADLAVRAFREKLPRQFHNIVVWSFRFFSGERMLRWVMEHGGWVKVLQKSVSQAYNLAKVGIFIMGAFAFVSYLWKSR